MNKNFDEQAKILVQKIRHYLVTNLGRLPERAHPWELFQALSFSLREQIMINWAATANTINQKKVRRVYYLSMEYLPGRMLINNISNLGAHALIKKVCDLLKINYPYILSIEPDPGLGNGGLGRLASCFLDSLATQQYPATAYGLRYQYGIFEQQIWEGRQIEKPDCWLLNENPWEIRHDGSARTIKFGGITKKRLNGYNEPVLDLTDFEEVRALPFDFPIVGFSKKEDYSVLTLRLWSTKESPHNFHLQRYNAGQIGPAAENTALTDVLYPNDNHETGKRIRLKQEFLLVSAFLGDIIGRHLAQYGEMRNFSEKVRIQINDTHPSLVVAELVRLLTKHYDYGWKEAIEATQEIVGFTNHTILSEAMEEWNKDRLSCLLPRQFWVIEKINQELMNLFRGKFPEDHPKAHRASIIGEEQIKMAHLAIFGSHKVNGVARLHGEILKNQVFKDFYDVFPEKFTYVTNGVTQRHWLYHCNPQLAAFITERIGDEWLSDFSKLHFLRDYAAEENSIIRFLQIKRENKQKLIDFLKEQNPQRDLFGQPLIKETRQEGSIDANSLFDVQIKRFHEYKRQLMNVLNLIMIYHDLLENPDSRPIKRTAFFAGKAAAGYLIAKYVIQLIYCIARKINGDPDIQDKLKVIFVENYSVTKAEIIIPAAELSEQISTAGMEASGTGNMKLAINGALTIGTEDGANIEMRESVKDPWWPFSFGSHAQDLEELRKSQTYNPWDIYSKNPKIKKAMDSLKDGTFAVNDSEEEALHLLFESLMLGNFGQKADKYFVLHDLAGYYEMQKKVETHYLDQKKWAQTALQNIAAMGPFSSDGAIEKYAQEIWGIEKCPIDPAILKEVQKIYWESTLHIAD